jgi:4'-phosphopantetheinyl transferase EntD
LNLAEDAQLLQSFFNQNLPQGCIGAVRAILPEDDRWLSPGESLPLQRAVPQVRRASGAGRHLARTLCAQLGFPVAEILRSPARFPLWPPGMTGSITHDRHFAAAVAGPLDRIGGLGVDIEPAEPLADGVRELVGNDREWAEFSGTPFHEKALFSIKEAIFKSAYPLDGISLDFYDVVVAPGSCTARTSYGRTVDWRVSTTPRVLAIAWW